MKMTALYERISREDSSTETSLSILRQKEYLEAYAAANSFENCQHYTDDGFSGRNFERPGWQQLIADIDSGKIGAVLVKDMSRIGRLPANGLLHRNLFQREGRAVYRH